MKLSNELKDYIISFCSEMKIRNIDVENINIETSLDLDLNIFDLDLDVFMGDFTKKFDIDISDFQWGKQLEYASGKGMSALYLLFRSFNYKREWVRKVCSKLYVPKLFVKDFQNAIDHKSFITT